MTEIGKELFFVYYCCNIMASNISKLYKKVALYGNSTDIVVNGKILSEEILIHTYQGKKSKSLTRKKLTQSSIYPVI